MGDRQWIYLAAFLRAMGLSMLAILVGAYLVALDLSPLALGTVSALGLAGCTVAATLMTLAGDRVGRRRALMATALLTGAGGLALAAVSAPWTLGVASFVGMLNVMGKDRGAALVLEQAMLPATVTDEGRTSAFAWYHVAQDLGHALGAAAAAMPLLLQTLGLAELPALRWAIVTASALIAISAVAYLGLSAATEANGHEGGQAMSLEGQRVVRRLGALFLLDAIGGGFLTTSWLSAFFIERFAASIGLVAALFVGARILNAGSHLGAAWLARRIGLVNTMVFAHIPSSVLLITVAIAPNFPVAAILFLLREGLVEMDVPTRQSYLMAVIRPEDRTRASGITSLVRMGGWTIGQAAAGAAAQSTLGLSLAIGAGMKIAYDLLLFAMFRSRKPPEEA